MTLFQKEQVRRMRHEGIGYSKIATCLSLSENTVKSYCKRNNLGSIAVVLIKERPEINEVGAYCKNCGKTVEQKSNIKPRKFCSDKCRISWWNSHQDHVLKKAIYHLKCAACEKPFDSYGNKNRKYCTHACYIQGRFRTAKSEARNENDPRAI